MDSSQKDWSESYHEYCSFLDELCTLETATFYFQLRWQHGDARIISEDDDNNYAEH